GRLLARDMANRVERINPQIQQRATTSQGLRKSPCARWLLPEEATLERLQLPEPARLNDPDRLLPHWLVVHAVADHQFDLSLTASVDHLVAFGARNRHRLLAQYMLSRLRTAHRVLAVHAVRQTHVNRIYIRVLADLVKCLVRVDRS